MGIVWALTTLFSNFFKGNEDLIIFLRNFTIRGVSKNMIITPNVVQNVRNHFNCQNVSGGELEDQGSNASIGSHWERRVYGDEVFILLKKNSLIFFLFR